MPRHRPEQPSDTEPDRDAAAPLPKPDKRQRKRQEEVDAAKRAAAADSPEERHDAAARPESGPGRDTERVRREVAAEAALRERVVWRAVAARLPAELIPAIERVLAGTSAAWHLEKGRYLFSYLVGERTLTIAERPVRVRQRLAIAREQAPADPEKIEERIERAVNPGLSPDENIRKLESLQSAVAPGDEVRIRLAPDQPEVVVTAETVTVETVPRPAVEHAVEPSPDVARLEVVETADDLEPVDASRIERLIAAVEAESPELPGVGTAPDVPSDGIAERPDTEPPPSTRPEREPAIENLTDVLAAFDREGVSLNDLPPIAGGASEPGESGRLDEPPEAAEPPTAETPETEAQIPTTEDLQDVPPETTPESPERPARRPRRRPSRRRREILQWEPGWAEAVRYPDHAMRQKGRKLIRRLAAEYGIKLTPQLEAYLLGILLQPHLINGRTVYGLGLNLERLVSVVQVLKLQFNLTPRPRP